MSSTNQAATANQEGQEFRRVGDDEPDESDMYAAYRDDKPAIKFFKTNDDVKSFLRADDGYGQRNDQWWRGGIPIHAPDYPPGPKCDWERIKELLKEEETLKYRQRERDSTSGGSTEKTKERLRLKIHVTSAGLDPLPTCFIRDFATIETNAMHRRGHQYEQLQIEAKDVPRRLWLFFEDLVSAYRYQFPEASCAAVADFMTSLNVHHRLEQDANGITRFFGISHLDYALKFMLRRVAGLADEIRTEVFTPPVGERQSKSGEVELTSQQPARLRTRGNLPQDKGNLQLLGSTDGALKKAVTLEIARRFGGVTRRAIDHAAQKGFLKSVGKRQQRRILVDSLLEYFPPEK